MIAQYTYAPNWFRMSKEVNGEITFHVLDGSNMVVKLNKTDDVIIIRGKSLKKTSDVIYYIYNGHGYIVAWLMIKMKGGG